MGGLGEEYGHLYKKYHIDTVMSGPNATYDLSNLLELYLSVFCKHIYYDPSVTRDIHIVIAEGAQSPELPQDTKSPQSIKRKYETLLNFRNPKPYGFNLENYRFELLLQTVKPEKIIQLFTALLLERKVVLIKEKIGDIALIMQSLISLLNPFTWHFTIITYLTEELVEFLEAPVPYLIGVSKKTWEEIGQIKEYPSDIVIFDLESQERKFTSRTQSDLVNLPKAQRTQLLQDFREIINRRERRLEALKLERPNISIH